MRLSFPLILAGTVLLFWNLGRPALWQDEAETALRAESILERGAPYVRLGGVLVTAQPSLASHEAGPLGLWTWNTWLPAYLTAGSFLLLGRTPFAARLPFALFGVLSLLLASSLFRDERRSTPAWTAESALAFLSLSTPFLLFCRQSRYYGLVALGTLAALHAYRMTLRGSRWGPAALAASLLLLLNSSFVYCPITALALALDLLLRRARTPGAARVWTALAGTALLAAPEAVFFRIWDRPGNHAYGLSESLDFLRTFLLWLARFAIPVPLALLASARKSRKAALGACAAAVFFCTLAAEGAWPRLAGAAALAGLVAAAAGCQPLSLERLALLLSASTLGVLSFGASEPYGRYLAGLLPAAAYLTGLWVARLASGPADRALPRGSAASKRFQGAAAAAALTGLALTSNALYAAPIRLAALFAGPAAPVESVSGMLRQRLRDSRLRSDLALFVSELRRRPQGYVEAVGGCLAGGKSFFSDSDALSYFFFLGRKLVPVLPEELAASEPDWLLPSPWLELSPETLARVRELAGSGRYDRLDVQAPALLWQNNPDPLVRDFSPAAARIAVFRRRE